jgi:hypothetical protein
MQHAWEITKIRSSFIGKLEGNRPFGRPRRRWEDYIEVDHKYEGRVQTG